MTQYSLAAEQTSALATNKVLRNTYMLLGATLLFSALVAGVSMLLNAPPMHWLMMLGAIYGSMALVFATRNSVWGLPATFLFTGVMGYSLGPVLNMFLSTYGNGQQLIMTALGATGLIFFALSGYVMSSRKDFSYLNGFLFVGVMAVVLAMIANAFLQIPALHLTISAVFVLISSGMILFHTSQIINGGERNYIMATISLYVAIYNLFMSLLHILSAFSGRD